MHIHACTCRHLQTSPQRFRIKRSDTSRYRNHPLSSTTLGMDGPSIPLTVRSSGAACLHKPVLTETAKKDPLLFRDPKGVILVPIYGVVRDVFDDPVDEEKTPAKKISNKKVAERKETDTQGFVLNKSRKPCKICGKKPRAFLICHHCERKVCCKQRSCSSADIKTCTEYPNCKKIAKGSS